MQQLHSSISLPVGFHTTLPEFHQLSSFPTNSQDSKIKIQAQETNKKKTMKTNNNATLHSKGYVHTLEIKKATNQAQQVTKYQKHKTSNKHHDSIPMVPKETQPEPPS